MELITVSFSLQGNVTFNLPLYLHRGVSVCVRAVCESGAMTTVCQEPKTSSHPNDFDKTTLYEMSTESFHRNEINTFLSSKNIGSKLSLIHNSEVDFVRLKTNLVGVILGGYGRKVKWYLMQKPESPLRACSDDPACLKEVESTDGAGRFHRTNLQKNMKYYICAFSSKTFITREFFTETLEEINTCGNGFVVDNDPPVSGEVTLMSNNYGFLTSQRNIRVLWNDFQDIDEVVNINYKSGIASYQVSLGTCTYNIYIVLSNYQGILSNYEWFPWIICKRCGMTAGNAYPGHLVPSSVLGLAYAPMFETSFPPTCLYTTFHLEYPSVLSRFCISHILIVLHTSQNTIYK